MPSTRSKLFRQLCVLTLLILPGLVSAAPGGVGDRVSAALFCDPQSQAEEWNDSLKLIVLAPQKSEYDGMLRLAFNQYFRNQHAFSGQAVLPGIKVVHVSGKLEAGGMVFGDSDCIAPVGPEALTAIGTATGVSLPKADDADATVLLLDQDNVVRWRDDSYRAQGEHLKPLETAVKDALGRRDSVAIANPVGTMLGIGDPAPDVQIVRIEPGGRLDRPKPSKPVALSSLRGKVVLLAFYPAAFSGTLPTVEGEVADKVTSEHARWRREMMSCALQLSEMGRFHDLPGLSSHDVVKLAITSSTPELLSGWARVLGTGDLHYVNDQDYSISRRYGSYDARAGYNLRKVFIVGRDGRIAFIDEDYTVGDAATVVAALETASTR